MKAPKENNNTMEPGVYNAVCYSVVDLGTRHSETFDKSKRDLSLGFRLLDKKYEDGNQVKMHRTLTFSMNEKATLRKWIQSWFAGTGANLDDFDFQALLNKGCALVVGLNQNNRPTIQNVMPYNSSVTFQDVQLFSLEDWTGGDLPGFLMEWQIQEIRQSEEYKQKWSQSPTHTTSADVSDDVPF